MAEFGVGRSTVREVLLRLESVGIVSLVRHRGATVRRLTRDEVGALLDLVEVLLALAAARAAERSSGPPVDDALHELDQAIVAGDFGAFVTARELFYRRLVMRSGNRELARLFPSALVRIMRLQLAGFGRAAEAMEPSTYHSIAAAVAAGNASAARSAARDHVRVVQYAIDSFPSRAFASASAERPTQDEPD